MTWEHDRRLARRASGFPCEPELAVEVVELRCRFADPGTVVRGLCDLAFDRRQCETVVRATETRGGAAVHRHCGHHREP